MDFLEKVKICFLISKKGFDFLSLQPLHESSTEDEEGTSGGIDDSDVGANGSNYDSGAFSRTSSPTGDEFSGGGRRIVYMSQVH